MLLFRRQDLETSARALIQACYDQSSSSSSDTDTKTNMDTEAASPFLFTNWQITESSEPNGAGVGVGVGVGGTRTMYLTHPPVTQVVSKSSLLSALSSSSFSTREDRLALALALAREDMLLEASLEDDSILVDDHDHHDHPHEIASSASASASASEVQVIWNVSVVYSETFQVPVLYFTLEYTNGSPVERRLLISLLSLTIDDQHDDDDDVDSQEEEHRSSQGVSQDLHPETGRPSYFLHPCQTNDTIHQIQMTTTTTITACSPSSLLWMWTWMSMVLPAIGHGIPSKYFLDIQQRLLQQDKVQESNDGRKHQGCV
jgi:ubiquitin-like-conjugating enzyme ATG10